MSQPWNNNTGRRVIPGISPRGNTIPGVEHRDCRETDCQRKEAAVAAAVEVNSSGSNILGRGRAPVSVSSVSCRRCLFYRYLRYPCDDYRNNLHHYYYDYHRLGIIGYHSLC